MDHAYESSTVQMDNEGYSDLKDQILNSKSYKDEKNQDIRQELPQEKPKQMSSSKKLVFKKGESAVELDDDYEVELMADKKATRLTLRELKERASGDIAIKNRMHSLAEEKKRVQSTFKQFADIAKKDPLAALEFISGKANESDSEFEYSKYIQKLAEQAEKLGQMDEKERKSFELERKLEKANEDLSQKEREANVFERRQSLLESYPEIGDSQLGQMVDAVLSNDELLEGLEDEKDIMDKVEELIQETLTQRDLMTIIGEINADYINDNDLIFSLSDQLRQNPDLDEEDVRDIVSSIIAPEKKSNRTQEKERDKRILSTKARQATPVKHMRNQNATPYDFLMEQLKERKNELSKTPLYKR